MYRRQVRRQFCGKTQRGDVVWSKRKGILKFTTKRRLFICFLCHVTKLPWQQLTCINLSQSAICKVCHRDAEVDTSVVEMSAKLVVPENFGAGIRHFVCRRENSNETFTQFFRYETNLKPKNFARIVIPGIIETSEK